ncbi:hypothetical protein FOXYSP1_19758 [Fusarium oxysporum f. sp. phaseoli]
MLSYNGHLLIHRQQSHPTLPPAKLQKLERLSLYYNLPEAAIICTKCGFALSPKHSLSFLACMIEHPSTGTSLGYTGAPGIDEKGTGCIPLTSAGMERIRHDCLSLRPAASQLLCRIGF